MGALAGGQSGSLAGQAGLGFDRGTVPQRTRSESAGVAKGGKRHGKAEQSYRRATSAMGSQAAMGCCHLVAKTARTSRSRTLPKCPTSAECLLRAPPRKRRRRRPEVEAHAGAMLQLLSMLPLSNENGLARTPPLGWRSWNLYGANVNQSLIEGIMDGMMRKDVC